MARIARTRWYLLAALVLGVATTIGVAWYFAATRDMFSYSDRWVFLRRPAGISTGPDGVWISQHGYRGCTGWSVSYEVGIKRQVEVAPSSNPPLRVASWAAPWVKPWEHTPSGWPAFGTPTTPYAIQAHELRAYGWPLPALCFRRWVEDTTGPAFFWETRGTLVVPWLRTPDGVSPRFPLLLPYLPLVTGFLVNTALYAALWAALLVGVRRWRIRRRVRRRICVTCGYDLSGTPGGAPCPECGRGDSSQRSDSSQLTAHSSHKGTLS